MCRRTWPLLAALLGQLVGTVSAYGEDSAISHNETVQDYQGSLRLAWLHHQAGRHTQALRYYHKALEYSPGSIDARLGVLLQYISQGKWARARGEGEAILMRYPDNHWATRYMALVDYMQGRHHDAERRYFDALAQTPGDPLMELGLGLSLVMQNKIREGRRHCGRASVTLRQDQRVAECLRIKPKEWLGRSQVYLLGGSYSDPFDRDAFAGGTALVEAIAPSGMGFEIDLSVAWSSLPYAEDNTVQYGTGAALFYRGQGVLGWIHYAALISPNTFAQVVSAHGEYDEIEAFKLSGGLDIGLYDGFQTFQFSPELSYKPTRWLSGTFKPMLQLRSGEVERSEGARSISLRASTEFSLTASEPRGAVSVSAFVGERWFTVENRGLVIWNVDEDLAAGLRANLSLWPNAQISPSLTTRIDFIDHQFGIAHETYVLTAAAGISTIF